MIKDTQRMAGILLGVSVVLFGLYLNKNYDKRTGKLEVFGATLQIGENKAEKNNHEVETEE